MFGPGDVAHFAVAGDHFQGSDVVRRHSQRCGQRADTAAAEVADDTDVGGRAGHRSQPVRSRGVQNLLPPHPRTNPGGSLLDVNCAFIQPRRVDEQNLIANRHRAVSGGLHCHLEAGRCSESDRLENVVRVSSGDHGGRRDGNCHVPGLSQPVFGVGRQRHRARQHLAQGRQVRALAVMVRCFGAHENAFSRSGEAWGSGAGANLGTSSAIRAPMASTTAPTGSAAVRPSVNACGET